MGVPEDRLPEVVRSPVETTPPTINDTDTASRVLAAVSQQMGEDYLYDEPRKGMGAEDFAYFVEPGLGVKGVYFAVGGTPQNELDSAPSHHSPFFKVQPEPSIKSGIEATVISAMTLFGD
jgi:hippurate hydrolase